MPGKTRGGSRAQHVKAGKQSHKNSKTSSPRGGRSAIRPRRETVEAETGTRASGAHDEPNQEMDQD